MSRVVVCIIALVIAAAGCAAPQKPAATAPEQPAAQQPAAQPIQVDIKDAWKNATVRIAYGEPHELAQDMVQVRFSAEWCEGQPVTVTYPKMFKDSATGQEVAMNFMWDNGGNIKSGLRDATVDIDLHNLQGVVLHNLPLQGDKAIEVVINLNGALLQLGDSYNSVSVYPVGTYKELKERGLLEDVPEGMQVAGEYLGKFIAPSGKFDITYKNAEGKQVWIEGFEFKAGHKMELPQNPPQPE
jgi:hypothetical protein